MGVMAVPTVPNTLLLLTTNWVAPASECIAPSAVEPAMAPLSNDTMRDGAMNSALIDAIRSTGVRSSSRSSHATGRLNRDRDFIAALIGGEKPLIGSKSNPIQKEPLMNAETG